MDESSIGLQPIAAGSMHVWLLSLKTFGYRVIRDTLVMLLLLQLDKTLLHTISSLYANSVTQSVVEADFYKQAERKVLSVVVSDATMILVPLTKNNLAYTYRTLYNIQ